MALINRFSRLFTADLHAVLDRMEEPEALLRQAVREMEDELARMRHQEKVLRGELERLATAAEAARQRVASLDEELDICFESGEDTLARSLIKRKLESERRGGLIAAKHDETARQIATLQAAISDNEAQFDSARQHLETLTSAPSCATTLDYAGGDKTIGEDEIDVAFLREKQRRAS